MSIPPFILPSQLRREKSFLLTRNGTVQGQANHFTRYAPERIEYSVNRYQNETRRLYRVLNTHLEKSTSGYLVGDKATIADFTHYGYFIPFLPS
jgi:glutathione S-transferase